MNKGLVVGNKIYFIRGDKLKPKKHLEGIYIIIKMGFRTS